MADQASNKRSIQNVLINRPLQREFTVAMLMIMTTAALIVGLMIHSSFRNMIEGVPPTISKTTFEQMILDANSQLVVSSILIIFLAVIATGFFGVFFLHRVAGPVYRFHRVLERLGHGELLNEVQLRKGDFFTETAGSLNQVIQLLKRQAANARTLEELLSRLSRENLSEEIKNQIQSAHQELRSLRKPS